jgi:hypothetical protein
MVTASHVWYCPDPNCGCGHMPRTMPPHHGMLRGSPPQEDLASGTQIRNQRRDQLQWAHGFINLDCCTRSAKITSTWHLFHPLALCIYPPTQVTGLQAEPKLLLADDGVVIAAGVFAAFFCDTLHCFVTAWAWRLGDDPNETPAQCASTIIRSRQLSKQPGEATSTWHVLYASWS